MQTEGLAGAEVHHLDSLERQWIAMPARPGARARYEAMLGADIFQRLVIADRHLGRGYISGGETAQSPLSQLVRDPETLERYLVGLLDYVFETLGAAKPDLVFCHTVADAPALALALAAQYLDIAFAQLRHTRIGDRVIIDTTPYDCLKPVAELFERFVLTRTVPPAAIQPAEAYLAALRNSTTVPDYLAYHSRRVQQALRPARLLRTALACLRAAAREAIAGQARDLRQPSPLALCRHELRTGLRTARLLRRGPFRPSGWRPARQFAFYPLHVDPEASTMVQSPLHTDQLAVIEAIVKSLPDGMPLLVKEHIPMLGRRPAGFYERLSRLPGVELASPFEQGAALARDAALTAVISSTAGWEAIVLGKPTLVIAFPPYSMVNDGFVGEPELTRLRSAITAALAAASASEQRLLAYVAAALQCSFACPTEIIWGRVTERTVAENPQVLAEMVGRLHALALPEPAARRLSS